MENKEKPFNRAQYAKMTKEERLKSFKRTIAHPHLAEADKKLREAISETGGASLINVYGPARVGKTTLKNHVIRTIVLEMQPLLEKDRERFSVVSMRPRPPLSGSFSWKDFFQIGLVAFDEPMIANKIVFDENDDEEKETFSKADKGQIRRKPPEGTKDALRASFITAARRRRPAAIFIDEAQHIGKISGVQLQNQLDCIKSLAEETEVPIVLIGTYELLPLLKLSAQLIGRSLDIHFPRYRSSEKELSQFQNVLRTFQNALPFTKETDILLKHWEFCYQRSIGCVGNLRLMLVRAVRAALWTDAKALTWKQIKTYAFTEAESYEMMLEAYEGEKNLALKPKQHEDLLKMLGLPSKRKSQETSQPSTTPDKDIPSKPTLPQPDLLEESSNEVNQESPVISIDSEASHTSITPPEDRSEERFSEGNQISSAEVDLFAATCGGLKPAPDGKESNIIDEADQELPIEETSHKEVPPKPLRKPRNETARPFRRKTKRDRTGGPPLKNEDKI
jgi:hypothetical protein